MDYEVGVRLALILDNQKAADEKMDELLAAIRKLANASVEKVNQDVAYEAESPRPRPPLEKPRPPIEKPRPPLPPRKPPRRYDDEEDDEEIDDDDNTEDL